ncbi:polyprotein, partial [Enterovirus J115]
LAGQPYFYAGIVTMWYQTNFVVPDGAPTSANIIALGAAQSNFCLRLLKDSPDISQTAVLTQGPPTEFGKAIENSISKVVNGLSDTKPSTSILETSNTPALQAAETGATSNATDEGLVETRAVINTKKPSETTVQAFFARAGLVGMVNIIHSDTNSPKFASWVIDTMGFVQQRRKLELFTYMRFSAEFTFVISTTTTTEIPNTMIQYMYIPPGSPVPTSSDGYEWQSGTNPSVIVRMTEAPARVRVPFISPAGAYAWFYDGYTDFGPHPSPNGKGDVNYGLNPANQFGTFAVRLIGNGTKTAITIRIYMKPTHVRCWVPRAPRVCPYIEKNRPSYNPSKTSIAANRSSITTTGAFGQQSGAVYVANYRIVNRHLANEFDVQNCVWDSYERDLLVSTTTAHGCDKIARCKCNTGVYFCRT